jgi:hypothetical protein
MKKQIIRIFVIFVWALLSIGFAKTVLGACGNDFQKNESVPNLELQFLSLQRHGDALAFRRGAADQPKLCKHYQGIARSKGYGTSYLYLSRSGIHTIGCTFDLDNPGELLIVEMGSRNKMGERFGSNRLKKNISLNDYAPPETDKGVYSYHFGIYEDSKGTVWPKYTHPGSMQLIDDVLIVALENYCTKDFIVNSSDEAESICPVDFIPPSWPWETWKNGNIEARSAIAFINVADPSAPHLIAIKEFPELTEGLGVVGAARIVPDGNLPGMYLFVMTWGNSTKLKLAYAIIDDLKNIKASDIVPVGGFWIEDFLEDDKGKWRNWQTLQFLRNYNENDPNDLYLIASEKAAGSTSKDWVSLFKFNLNKLISETPDPLKIIEFKYERHFHLGEPDLGSFDAASSLHVTPTGQLIIYSTSHKSNTEALDNYGIEVEVIPMGEFRNIFVSQNFSCGPQWRYNDPSKHLCVPDMLIEGESIEIDGAVYFIEPWVHLFEDKLEPLNFSGLGLMMDVGSQELDNFNDLDNFKFSGNDFKDDADAFTFCGPTGSTLVLNTEPFWGGAYLTAAGNGSVTYAPDLGDYGPYHLNFHDDIESIAITGWDSSTEPIYQWFLNGDSRGEIIENGETATYTAGCGSYEDTVTMQYEYNGIWDSAATINVQNIAPEIDELFLSNQTTNVGETITVSGYWSDKCAEFSDVKIYWGEIGAESIDENNDGYFSFTHVYSTAGVHTIQVCVNDGYDENCSNETITVYYDCSTALPSNAQIWPPNHKMFPVSILEVFDNDNNLLPITITDIFQDEPPIEVGGNYKFPDGEGIGTDVAWLRAERSGQGDGRVYTVFFTADDGQGLACDGFVKVCVPHDQKRRNKCIEGEAEYNSASGYISDGVE